MTEGKYQLFNMKFKNTKVESLRVFVSTISTYEMNKRAEVGLDNDFRLLSLLNSPNHSESVKES